MPRHPRRPNLFIVGAPKAGTTAMDDYLAQHPDIFMAPRKELHFFAPEVVPRERGPGDLDWYLAFFRGAGEEKVVGESSVFYLCSRQAAERIKAFDPAARIVIHVRNPVDFIASHHSQIVYEGYEDIEDLEAAYDAEPERRAGRRVPAACRHKQILLYREMARFSEQIARFFGAFGREKVLVNVFDDFASDTAGTYRRTLEFLGVDADFEAELRVVNANKQVRSRALMSLVRNSPEWVSAASRAVLPKAARDGIKAGIGRLNTRFAPRPPMRPEFRARLKREFAPEVERLGALLGRDLGHWCR